MVIILLGFDRFYRFINDYYRAGDLAWEYIENPKDGVTVEYVDNTIVFAPENPKAGFIFYPGALVETEAYAPLMEQLAEKDIECIIVEMPFYLALFDANGARNIEKEYPKISKWYLGGHSLGGAMSSLYAARHSDEYEGLILLASYSTKDLSKSGLDVLLMHGSNDQVLNIENYEKYLKNLPDDYEEVVIEGGCHSYFGDYGVQNDDGEPTISVEEQTRQTVDTIVDFVE